jgi:hypothetical protein
LNQVVSVRATNLNDIKNTGIASGGSNSSGSSKHTLRYIIGNQITLFFPIINFFAIIGNAKPNMIEIGNDENVTVDIGLIDGTTGEFIFKSEEILPFYMNARFINFEVVQYPGNNSDGSWYVTFNPKSVQPKAGEDLPLKTQMTVSFTAPSNPKDTIQSGILKIKIKDVEAMGSLWWPRAPNGTITGSLAQYNKPINKFFWFLGALFAGYGKYTGTVDTETEAIVDILVKVKQYHNIRFETLPLIQFNPGEITSIPISVQNLGNYNDSYGFKIVGDYGKNIISDPLSISLEPGEEKDTYLGIAVTPNVLDTGTIHTITIEAYSIDQPNVTIAQRTVFLETKGIYISELGGAGALLFVIIAIVFGALFFYRRRKILTKSSKKPEKPWDMPEKKQELNKLRKEDRARYNAVLKEMENEYISSLSAYKSYRKKLLKESRKKSLKRFTDIFKRSDKQKKAKTKKPQKKQQISEKSSAEQTKKRGFRLTSPFKKRQKESGIDKSAETEKQRKERAISTINKEQEKQKRTIAKFKS